MRLVTWNCERGGHSRPIEEAQRRLLAAVDADIAVLTEPPVSLGGSAPGRVAAPQRRTGPKGRESWVVISGRGLTELDELPFGRLACSAYVEIDDAAVAVYASVLPWLGVCHQAPEIVRDDESPLDVFRRVLAEQVADVCALQQRYDHVIWAGDFNQSLVGPLFGGSRARRELLVDALASLSFTAWNGEFPHAKRGMRAVDLICGSATVTPRAVSHFPPVGDGRTLSDHAGYVIEF